MPSERFFRLPKAKADTIRNAAIQEFKRVTPEEASINKIIQSAEISRGSFYTYFEDKHDLLRWLLGDFVASYQQFYITELNAWEGDLWAVFDAVLDHTIQWVADQGLVEIVGNM
ncbi:MAG: TetR/AcrR family transcriptional regulator, partial [Lachnospiraceae bacterium]|nr:TetR/AcrR family transcriptional regulator [Lachnospiraceae bacterium]